jgi:hypothetical protein
MMRGRQYQVKYFGIKFRNAKPILSKHSHEMDKATYCQPSKGYPRFMGEA